MIFINSKDINLINNKISNLLKSKTINEFDRFDFSIDEISSLIEQLQQPSLFENNKIYVLDITSSLKNKKSHSELFNQLNNLKELETSNKIIFLISLEDIVSNINEIKQYANEVYSEQEITNKNKLIFIKQFLKELNLNLNENQVNILERKLPKNINIIQNEISKLNMDNLDKIEEIISDYNEYEIFNIINFYFQNNYSSLFKLLDKIFKDKDGEFYLLNYLSTKALNLYLIKKFLLNNWDQESIAKELSMNRFVVMNDAKLVSSINIKDIETLLYNLYNIEKISRTYYSDIKTLLKLLFLKVRIISNE